MPVDRRTICRCSPLSCGDRVYALFSEGPGMLETVFVIIVVLIVAFLAIRLILRHYFPKDT
jgi:hypothetical protein